MNRGSFTQDGQPPAPAGHSSGDNRLNGGGNCEIHDGGPIEIGEDLICGPGVKVYSGPQKPTVIGNKVWLGDHVEVRPGARIGDGAMVCAGTIVEGDVPPFAVLEGFPSRVVWYLR